jgi:toxin CptA
VSSQIDIPITPSRWVGCLSALPWIGLTLFNLILAQAYSAYFLVLIPVGLAGAVYQWNLNGRLSLNRSTVRLTVSEVGLEAQQRDGERYPVIPDSASRLYPRLIILKLKPSATTNRSGTVLLWARDQGPGNVPGDLHRQLRAWLRLGSDNS